jgi:hypothetical protein
MFCPDCEKQWTGDSSTVKFWAKTTALQEILLYPGESDGKQLCHSYTLSNVVMWVLMKQKRDLLHYDYFKFLSSSLFKHLIEFSMRISYTVYQKIKKK